MALHSFELLEHAACRVAGNQLITMLRSCGTVKAPALLYLLKQGHNLPD